MARWQGTTESRFWAKVNKDGPIPSHIPELGQCWVWKAARRGRDEYGYFRFGREAAAHRVSWILANGPIPENAPCVLHRCDNPACVRPDHLWVGTKRQNNADMVQKGRAVTPPPGKGRAPGSVNKGCGIPKGEQRPRARLTDALVRETRTRHSSDESMASIAREFDVSRGLIWKIIHRKRWNHVS